MDTDYFDNQLKEHEIYISQSKKKQLFAYAEMLIRWNKKINLVGNNSVQDAVDNLILDTLIGWSKMRSKCDDLSKIEILDLGSGGGIVGIPIKIMEETNKVFLLESNKKKCFTLDEIISSLSLSSIITLNTRAEILGRNPDYRERFGIIVVRAVSSIGSLIELSFPLLRKGGWLFSYKSSSVMEEISEAQKSMRAFNGEFSDIKSYKLPKRVKKQSCIVPIKKSGKVDPEFPRRAGIAQKRPKT
ncbi:MAG: 16S rRNA (guanine(527)-N(7))-methyltransferase RsmG [bacterium]